MEQDVTFDNIADYFISMSNTTGSLITNLQLQKLVYYAQAWHLAIHHKPLFKGQFQAWIHGPVLPELYGQYKHYQWRPIERDDLDEGYFLYFRERFGEELTDFMNDIVDEYFGLSGYELERLTHLEAPWKQARGSLPEDAPSTNVIREEWMKDYYSQYIKEDA